MENDQSLLITSISLGNLPGSSADAEGMSWALIANWQRAGFDDYRPVIVATVVVSLIVSRHR